MSTPAIGSIPQQPPTKAKAVDPYAQPGSFNGKYIGFTYPPHYKQIPSQKTGKYLEVDDFFATDHSSKHISVGILAENLSDDSGYNYRKQHPQLYRELPLTRYGASFASSSSGSEVTAYTEHNGLTATISVTAPSSTNLTDEVQGILTSLSWK